MPPTHRHEPQRRHPPGRAALLAYYGEFSSVSLSLGSRHCFPWSVPV